MYVSLVTLELKLEFSKKLVSSRPTRLILKLGSQSHLTD